MYRIVTTPTYRPVDLALAKRYQQIEHAVADMGEGVVVGPDGQIAAFHEKHFEIIKRRADLALAAVTSTSDPVA